MKINTQQFTSLLQQILTTTSAEQDGLIRTLGNMRLVTKQDINLAVQIVQRIRRAKMKRLPSLINWLKDVLPSFDPDATREIPYYGIVPVASVAGWHFKVKAVEYSVGTNVTAFIYYDAVDNNRLLSVTHDSIYVRCRIGDFFRIDYLLAKNNAVFLDTGWEKGLPATLRESFLDALRVAVEFQAQLRAKNIQ